jgi:hypothetical protein
MKFILSTVVKLVELVTDGDEWKRNIMIHFEIASGLLSFVTFVDTWRRLTNHSLPSGSKQRANVVGPRRRHFSRLWLETREEQIR